MFGNVVVGVDGHQGGSDAIALAAQLAMPDARITLAHAYGDDWMLGRGAELALTLERAESERLLETARAEAGIDAWITALADASAGRSLHRFAEKENADLLVVGSSRHGLLGRVLIGDDTRAALNGAPSAVAIAPRGYAHSAGPIASLGVGYDASSESRFALAVGRELAVRLGASIKALWVVSLQNVRDDRPIPADWPQAAEELVEDHRARMQELGDVEGDAVYGGPREELARLSENVDLLIVGSRGYGPRERLMHGSVSTYLVCHAACPLLVLPRVARIANEATGARASVTEALHYLTVGAAGRGQVRGTYHGR